MSFLTCAEARARLLGAVQVLERTEIIPLEAAAGRTAAAQMLAVRDQPPFDRSPLDGYALFAEDAAGASREAPVTLPVAMRLCAGDAPQTGLARGTAARIMTGAPVPGGANCVIRQEDTDCGEEKAAFYKAPKAGGNICYKGEDIAAGAPIIKQGEKITPAALGVLAGQGYAEISVYKRVTVGIISTGSELLRGGEAWREGKIYDANSVQEAARLAQLGFSTERRTCADDPAVIRAEIEAMLASCDAVITNGGVSVGQKDYLPAVIEAMGLDVVFQGVAMKPGSPMLAAMAGAKPVLCLSGNPFAAAATLELLALPALLRLAGRADAEPRRGSLTLENDFLKRSPHERFLRARAEGGSVYVAATGHSSGSLAAMVGCNCFVDIPAGTESVRRGEKAEVVYFE